LLHSATAHFAALTLIVLRGLGLKATPEFSLRNQSKAATGGAQGYLRHKINNNLMSAMHNKLITDSQTASGMKGHEMVRSYDMSTVVNSDVIHHTALNG
jgi:hypothetical protein